MHGTRARVAALMLVALVSAGAGAAGNPCAEASKRSGRRVCVGEIPSRALFDTLVIGLKLRFTRYLVPARSDARLPVLFLDANTYEFHQDLMGKGFPDLFPGLDARGYARLALNPARREFYAGNVVRHTETGAYGFTVEEVPSGPINPDDVERVWRLIKDRFRAGPLSFEPSDEQRSRMAGKKPWRPLAMPVRGAAQASAYIAYVNGAAFGRLRRIKADAVPDDLGPEDVTIFDAAPFDLPTPVAGAVTVAPHAELSHLNVRSAARGTPSCRLADAWTRLESYEGALVRIECGPGEFAVRAASADEVAAALRARRPMPIALAPPDVSGTPDSLAGLLEIPTGNAPARTAAKRRYGAKAANLAALAQRIPAEWTVRGFAIPFSAYDVFVRQGSPSLSSQIDELFANPRFVVDPSYRTTQLARLRAAFELSPLAPGTVSAISAAIDTYFGAATMVRFRSSSNAEDDAQFSGAGLYDSVSVCLADDRDDDADGPSRCDPDTAKERGVAAGLTRVWASLWTDRAVAERLWYGIDPARVSMGVLVDPRAKNERANIVAFTGAPNGRPGDARAFLVEAQKGELDVVSSRPGVWPKQTRLIMAGAARTTPPRFTLERLTSSSEAREVLSEKMLREIGSRLSTIQSVFPVDDVAPAGTDIVLDTEWKVLSDGRLAVKQVRPFLRRAADTSASR
jgi:hypothetical protein